MSTHKEVRSGGLAMHANGQKQFFHEQVQNWTADENSSATSRRFPQKSALLAVGASEQHDLQQGALLDPTTTVILMILTSPDGVTVILYTLFSLILFAYYFLIRGHKAANLAVVYNQRDNLMTAFNALTQDVEDVLNGMQESNALLAERNLDAKRREFQKFLARCNKAHGTRTALLEAIRNFISRFLHVFEQCSFDPVKEPNIVVTDKELIRCTTPAELIELTIARLETAPLQFVKSRIDSEEKSAHDHMFARKAEEERNEKHDEVETDESEHSNWGMSWCRCAPCVGCGCRKHNQSAKFRTKARTQLMMLCCTLTVLSRAHLALLFSFVAGLLLIGLELAVERFILVAMVCIAVLFLLAVLLRYEAIDELCILEAHVEQIEAQTRHVQRSCDNMLALNQQFHILMDLWRFRTFPCFELIQELYEQCLDCPATHVQHLLVGAAEALLKFEQQLGPVYVWCGDPPLPEVIWKEMHAQFKAVSQYVRSFEDVDDGKINAMVQGLDGTFGFIGIRAFAAHNLRNLDSWTPGDQSDPFVKFRVGRASAWEQTPVVKDDLNPVWTERYFLCAPFREELVELEVMDKDGVKSELMGVLKINFRCLKPGVWHHVRKPLTRPEEQKPPIHDAESLGTKCDLSHGGKDGHGVIEFELQYASEVSQTLSLHQAVAAKPTTRTSAGMKRQE